MRWQTRAQTLSKGISDAQQHNRGVGRALATVEALDPTRAQQVLGLSEPALVIDAEPEDEEDAAPLLATPQLDAAERTRRRRSDCAASCSPGESRDRLSASGMEGGPRLSPGLRILADQLRSPSCPQRRERNPESPLPRDAGGGEHLTGALLRRVGVDRPAGRPWRTAAASFSTRVPLKKSGFCVPHSFTALVNTKSRKLSWLI